MFILIVTACFLLCATVVALALWDSDFSAERGRIAGEKAMEEVRKRQISEGIEAQMRKKYTKTYHL